MLSDKKYRTVFSEDRDVGVYLTALELCKRVEEMMLELGITAEPYECRNYVTLYRFLYAHLLAEALLGRPIYSDGDVLKLAASQLTPSLMESVHRGVLAARIEFLEKRPSGRKMHRSSDFQLLAQAKVHSAATDRVLRAPTQEKSAHAHASSDEAAQAVEADGPASP
jgi:hypothetical protein